MDIAITGSSGLVGSLLVPFLTREGHRVHRVLRDKAQLREGDVWWDPQRGEIDAAPLEGIDAVIHLAGENIGDGRWSEARKDRIRRSRVDGTRLIARTLARLEKKPSVLISGSAIGVYGNAGDVVVDESGALGRGFLSEVVREWEEAASEARDAGIRVVHPRIGVVLSREGGALAKLITPFRLGVGGRIGSGKQYMSWIAIDDLLFAIRFLLITPDLSGPVNVVAPRAVTNSEFTNKLAHALHRPAVTPLPAFAVRLAFGQMGQELLLDGARVVPQKLLRAGFVFAYPKLDDAFQHLLQKPATT